MRFRGVEPGDGVVAALLREVVEETGQVVGELGMVVEILHKIGHVQESYGCPARSVGGVAQLTDEGSARGLRLIWKSLPEALALFEDVPQTYRGQRIQKRDAVFLKKASEQISKASQMQL